MSKLYPRLFAVLLTIGCCSQAWAQLTIDATCDDSTVQCVADLDAITCPEAPTLYDGDEAIGTAECLLVSERDKNREICTATTAIPNSGSNAGALVLYNLQAQAAGVASQYFVPTASGLELQRFESGEAILTGSVQGVADPTEIWNVFIVYEGKTSDNDHVAGGGGLKYDPDCAPVDTASVEWDIYYMNGGMSYLEGQGSLAGSLLSLNHAPANQYFGFQVGEKANDRNCNYGAGGWFSWSGSISTDGGETLTSVGGAMGDVLVDLACQPPVDYDPCSASVTCYCVGVDLESNEFEVFSCTTTRVDDTPPTFNNAPEDVTIQCTDPIPAVAVFTATDNCEPGDEEVIDAVLTADTVVNPNGLNGCYTIVRTWTATDACGNTAGHTQVITIEDTVAPVWNDFTPYVMESCLVILTQEEAEDPSILPITATDNCDDALDYSIVALEISGGCPTTWLRKWTATDDCGKSSVTVEQYVQLYDDTPPAIDAPADITIYADADCAYDSHPETTLYPTYSDHCTDLGLLAANLTYSDETVDGACDGSVIITRTWSTTDFCGNSNSDTQIITVLDTIAPTGSVSTVTLDCAAYDGNTEYGSVTSDDNCSAVSYTWTTITDRLDAEDGEACYYYLREYTLMDDCGNTSTTTQTIWLEDNTPPELISAEENRNVTCDAYGNNMGGVLITAEDDCGEVTITFDDAPLSGGCVTPVGRFERTYTIADECGNSINFTQFLTLTDNQAPELTVDCPENTILYSDSYCEHNRNPNSTGFPTYTVTDGGCQEADSVYVWMTYDDSDDDVVCEGQFTFTRTWTVNALDHCFNMTTVTCEQHFTVMDQIAPATPGFSIFPEDVTLELDDDCNANTMPGNTGYAHATTLDNCDTDPEIYVGYTDGTPEYHCEEDEGSTFSLSASLGAFESASASLEDDIVVVGLSIDLNWSSAGCTEWPSDLTLEITSPGGECLTVAGFADVDPNPACDGYSWPESWNTTTSGNFVLDIALDNELSGSGTWNLEVTENWAGACGVDFDLDATLIRRGEGSYSFTRTWSAYAVDCSGNQSGTVTEIQEIHVIDVTAPTIDASSPNNITISCEEFDGGTVYGVTASDNCDSNVHVEVLYNVDCDGDLTHGYSNSEVSGTCAGTYIRTYLATDDCNNTTQFEQVVNLVDETAPVITLICPGNIVIEKDADCAADDSIANAGDATYSVSDNCTADDELTSSISVSDGEPTAICAHSYSFLRTWTVTASDVCENVATASCSQLITVVDNSQPVPPEIVVLGDTTIHRDANCASDAGPDADPALALDGNDNCTADDDLTQNISYSDDTLLTYGSLDCSYTIVRTWSASLTDECGNTSATSTYVQTIQVVDAIDPSISLDATHSIACESYDPAGIYASAADNCDPNPALVLTSQEYISGADGCQLYMHTYTATDCSGNSHTASHYVQLIDGTAPSFDTFPGDALAECGTSISPEALGTPTASDNCADDESLTLTYSDTTLTEKDVDCRTIERRWTIVDPCGNSHTQSQIIEVEDSGYPTITVAAADLTVECDGEGNTEDFENWLATYGGAEATDECTEELIWDYETPVISAGINPMLSDGCGATGTVTVTFYATDACGNSSPTTATFTIVDTQAPGLASVTFPEDYTLSQNGSCNVATGVNVTGVASATATDDLCCYSFVSIQHTDGPHMAGCDGDDALTEGSYSFYRTWTVYAYDECGNQSAPQSHNQLITVVDNTGPQFTETCGLTNGQVIMVDCEDGFGGLDIPEACSMAAQDNCDSEVSITCSVDTLDENGYAPNDEVALYGLATTPAAFLDNGNTCNSMDPHAMRLMGMPNSMEFYTLDNAGLAEVLPSGEIRITADLNSTVIDNAGWHLSLLLDPEEACGISHTGGQLQSCSPADLGISTDDIDAWQYLILNCNESTLDGFGPFSSGSLTLSHQPSNGHYAFQLGVGANQQNANFGLSGWFYYTGTFQGYDVMGSGDLFFDMDFCLPWAIEHTCTAVDDCGNETVFTYTYQMSGHADGDDAGSDLSGQSGSGDHTPVVIGGAGDLTTGKTPIRVTNLQPNPTNDMSQLGFVVSQNMRIRVDLIAMDGMLVAELYDGVAQTGVNHTLDIDAQSLSGGMYQIRLSSNDYLVVKKLLVSE